MRDLLTDPIWRAEELGACIPDDPHAASVALPLWAHCVGYEEGDPAVVDRLQSGYPRFVFHPIVRRLHATAEERFAGAGERCLVFLSQLAAERCLAFVEAQGADAGRCEIWSTDSQVRAVVLPESSFARGKNYWQHSGEGIGSRQAEALLEGRGDDPDRRAAAVADVRERLAGFYGVSAAQVWLYVNGMAAFAAANRALQQFAPGRRSVQLGFPYVDILKVQERFGAGVELITDNGPAGQARLVELLQRETLSGCVVETPGNPLLSCADVPALSEALRPAGVPLVVDDTIGTPVNLDVAPYADLIMSSLTKFFVGSGAVLGGSLVVPSTSPLAATLGPYVQADHEPQLWWEDAVLLAEQSRDMAARVARINATTAVLVERLQAHPAVARVLYPACTDRIAYDRIRRPDGGYGGLFSLELHAAERNAPRCYDSLRLCKGPSLGTNFTLVCPFTILAHYQELDWAEACGVSRWLLRFSIGLEDVDELWQRFDAALADLAT